MMPDPEEANTDTTPSSELVSSSDPAFEDPSVGPDRLLIDVIDNRLKELLPVFLDAQVGSLISEMKTLQEKVQDLETLVEKNKETPVANAATMDDNGLMTDSYSKEVIDEKLKNLEQKFDHNLDKVLFAVKEGFSELHGDIKSMKQDYGWIKNLIFAFGLPLLVGVIILIVQNSFEKQAAPSNIVINPASSPVDTQQKK